jgi:hypothetical protein
MIKVETVIQDEDSRIQGGINFYWEHGADQVLYQSWEHKGSGPVWLQVAVDPMVGSDLVDYLRDCWGEYTILNVVFNYR